MRKELSDFVKKNWELIPLIGAEIYGAFESGVGLYKVLTNQPGPGNVDLALGIGVIGTSTIAIILAGKYVSPYLHHEPKNKENYHLDNI